jgi:hypothetical protein
VTPTVFIHHVCGNYHSQNPNDEAAAVGSCDVTRASVLLSGFFNYLGVLLASHHGPEQHSSGILSNK